MEPDWLSKFRSEILANGAKATCVVSEDADHRYQLRYAPFDHVAPGGSLTVVGTTPGNTQLEAAYRALQDAWEGGRSDEQALRDAKKKAAFAGFAMRDRITEMLEHFGIHHALGASDARELWKEHLHTTSVIPHAAFQQKAGKWRMFAGQFAEIQRAPFLYDCFKTLFVDRLTQLGGQMRFVALGPAALNALQWCATDAKVIAEDQILGGFPHPSSAGGNQVDYLLGKDAGPFDETNPMNHRLAWLDAQRERLTRSVAAWRSHQR